VIGSPAVAPYPVQLFPKPKGLLTRLSSVIDLARSPDLRRATGVPELYSKLAESQAAGELSANAIGNLAANSMTTVEELLGLEHVDRRLGTSFIDELQLPRSAIRSLREAFSQTAFGGDELTEWNRFDQYTYALGFDLRDSPEPPVAGDEMDASSTGTPPADGHELGAPATATLPPEAVILITPCLSGVRDQQDRGTCTAFASVACLEHHLCRTAKATLRLSEQFQYWNMVEHTGKHSLVASFPALKEDGVCSAATWPYWGKEIPGNDGQGPPPPSAKAEAAAWKCQEVLQLPARSVERIKQALRDDHLVSVGFPVYRSWYEHPVVRKYGNITLPFPGEVPESAGHAVALVGFADDAEFAGGGYFIVRNSWDHVWGTNSVFGVGHGTLPYAYVERFNWDAWCITR